MTITTISYSQSKETVYSFGLKKWNKVGIDIAIDEKDDTQKVFEFAKETVENWLKEEVQQPVAQMDEQVVQLDNKKPKSELQALLDGIEACTQIDGDGEFSLGTFWLRAKGNLVTSAAYKLKEKQLKDAK